MHVLERLKKQRKTHNRLLWLCSLTPYMYLSALYIFDLLGANPFATLINHSAHWAMAFFILCYAISPARRLLNFAAIHYKWSLGKRLSDWNFLLYQRRMLGLASFYMASCHLLVYFNLELDFDWQELWYEITNRYFILWGLIAWILLAILGISSPNHIKKYLKSNWFVIHKIIHLCIPILIIHMYLEMKQAYLEFYVYLVIFAILVVERIWLTITKQNAKTESDRIKRKKQR